jgi:acyl-CoA thioester hydrolase
MVEVRFTDIDSQGHANHLSIAAWISHERVKLFDDAILWAKIGSRWDHVMVHISMDFKTPITYPNNVLIFSRVIKIGEKSVTTDYEVCIKGVEVARANCVNVFTRDSKPTKLPDSLKDALRDLEV